jgi:DNA-binding NtrC family response regulator
MILPAPENQEIRQRLYAQSGLNPEQVSSKQPSILLATTDPEIRHTMAELLQGYKINVLWASGMEEIKSALARQSVAACFCGFWLIDGTYRDVVRHLKRQYAGIPVVIVCAPTCPHEYRDYLAALNIRAFDFICHPYRRVDLERILHSAISLGDRQAQKPASTISSSDGSFGYSGLRRAS